MNLLSSKLLSASFVAMALAGCGGDVEATTGTAGNAGSAGTGDTGGTGGTGGMAGTAGMTTGGMAGTAGTGGMAGTAGTGTAGDIGMPSDMYPAPHPAPPKVINFGGPTVANPMIYPVYFSNDDAGFTASITDFTNKVGATNYWNAAVSEYGVGPATAAPPIQLAEAAPGSTDDTKIASWLAGKLNNNDPAFPTADDNTIIALYYPKGTTITLQSPQGAAQSCSYFGGYHNQTQLDAAHGNRRVAYTVVPRCQYPGQSELETLTSSASHEYIEAVTDPYPQDLPAYGQVDNAHIHWEFALGGGEVGDMCAQEQDSFVKFPELSQYAVQRSWSNKAAMAGHDPCQPPLPGAVYFNSAPVLPDNIQLNVGQIVNVKGVNIPAGQSKTIEVDLFSDGMTGAWDVDARDFNQVMGGSPQLGFQFDQTSGQNGQKLHLTITVLKASQYNAELFYLISTLGQQQNLWIGIVGN